MNTFTSLFLTAAIFLMVEIGEKTSRAAIKCHNCRTSGNDLVCEDPCVGEFCALWKHREMSIDFLIQGCFSGLDNTTLKMGCRTNQQDARLCFCSSGDLCNEDQRLSSAASIIVPMPSKSRCHSRTEASFIDRNPLAVRALKHRNPHCLSDYCFFRQSNTTNAQGQSEVTTSRSCGQEPHYNFDVLVGELWPGNGALANACYLLQIHSSRDSVLGCSCSHNNCNSEVPYPISVSEGAEERDSHSRDNTPADSPLVRCHLVNGATSEVEVERRDLCRGHFCLIQRQNVPSQGVRWTKGCLSANESAVPEPLRLRPGYRNIMGIEQWLCKENFCNYKRSPDARIYDFVAFASEGGQDEAASRRRNLSKVKWKASGGIGGRATASAAISAKKYDDTFLQSTSKEGKNNAQTTFPALLLVSFLFFFLFFRISY